MNSYGYLDFLKICYVSNPENFFGFVIKSDGVWMIPPDHERYRGLTPDELFPIFNNFSTHNFSTPVLPFPCTHQQLSKFLNKTGLDGMLDPASDLLLTATTVQPPPTGPGKAQGGRSKGPLAEAIEHLYLQLKSQGNTEIIRPGKVRLFVARLRESLVEGNRNFSDYIATRIKFVNRPGHKAVVMTEDVIVKITQGCETTHKSRQYDLGEISKILHRLRQQFPFSEQTEEPPFSEKIY